MFPAVGPPPVLKRGGKLGVELEAPPGERLKRRAVAPVEGKEGTDFPEAAQATPVRSMTTASTCFRLRK